MKIISIGSHPDDVELGMGGTLAKHAAKGDDVQTILCTLGGVSGDPKQREKEANKAAHVLRIKKPCILDFPVSKLNKHTKEFDKIINKTIEKFNPDRIYTHSPHDNHQVHVSVSKSVLNCAKNVKQIVFYEVISSTTPYFIPNTYVDITEFIDFKIKSIAEHKSQSHRFYMQPNVTKSLANTRYVWGKVGTDPYGLAEAFTVNKMIFN